MSLKLITLMSAKNFRRKRRNYTHMSHDIDSLSMSLSARSSFAVSPFS